MPIYTSDGGVISNAVPVSEKRGAGEHTSLFGIYRGIILRVIYPDDPQSKSRDRVEYVVRVKGQQYSNVIDMRSNGGIYDHSERIRKPAEKSFTGQMARSTLDENMDGEAVYVMFIEGHGDVPLIVGSDQHRFRSKYKKTKKADGRFKVEEFNGVEFKIDKDSNLTFTQLGKKDSEGKIANSSGVGSQITISANGDISLDAYGDGLIGNVNLKIKKADKSFTIQSNGHTFIIDATGIHATESGGAAIKIGGGKVGLGASSAEVVALISLLADTLSKDLGNLGYPLASASTYATIKSQADGIKGGI